MQLSKRLETIAGMVTEGSRTVDVGTDHGYLPIYLIENKRIPWALAMDIRKGPLLRAEEHIKEKGFSHLIETRLSDGLEKYRRGEGESVVIAGMGGALTVHILSGGTEKLKGIREMILSPQSEIFLVREYLQREGYRIVEEKMVEEAGKYYTVLKAKEGRDDTVYETYQMDYGYVMLKQKDAVLREYLLKQKKNILEIADSIAENQSPKAQNRRRELLSKLSDIDKALCAYQ